MPRDHGVIGRLGALDPAHGRLARAATGQDEALRRILGASPASIDDALVPATRRARGPIVAASVLAVLILAIALVLRPSPVDVAYAQWTPEPEPVGEEARSLVEQYCPDSAHEISGDGQNSQIRQVPVQPVVIDVRGDYIYAVSTDGRNAIAECFVMADSGEPLVVGSDAVGVDLAPEQRAEVTVLQAGTAQWSEPGGGLPDALTAAFGRAGPDVREIILQTESGTQVQATISDGWWVAWAPGEETFAGTMTVVTRDGAATQELLEGTS